MAQGSERSIDQVTVRLTEEQIAEIAAKLGKDVADKIREIVVIKSGDGLASFPVKN